MISTFSYLSDKKIFLHIVYINLLIFQIKKIFYTLSIFISFSTMLGGTFSLILPLSATASRRTRMSLPRGRRLSYKAGRRWSSRLTISETRHRQSASFTMKYKAVNATLECATAHADCKPYAHVDVATSEGAIAKSYTVIRNRCCNHVCVCSLNPWPRRFRLRADQYISCVPISPRSIDEHHRDTIRDGRASSFRWANAH